MTKINFRRHLSALILIAVGVVFGALIYRMEPEPFDRNFSSKVLTYFFDPQPMVGPVADAIDTRTCPCRRQWNVCPCQSNGKYASVDEKYFLQLTPGRHVVPQQSENFNTRLDEATGYSEIKLANSSDRSSIRRTRSRKFEHGILEEYYVDYRVPTQSVRLLHARNPTEPKGLFVITIGSWSSPEHILGMREEDYHRRIGQYYFRKGYDIAAFEHGSNGTVETYLNVDAMLQGTQIYGVWARSVCDYLNANNLREEYKSIYFYGLSRGGRVAEYTAALCPGFTWVVVGDNLSADNYDAYFWNGDRTGGNLKYGAWYAHLLPIIGHTSLVDFILAAKSPVVYTRSAPNLEPVFALIRPYFSVSEQLRQYDRWRFVFKSGIGHKPELELMDLMLDGKWSEIEGRALTVN